MTCWGQQPPLRPWAMTRAQMVDDAVRAAVGMICTWPSAQRDMLRDWETYWSPTMDQDQTFIRFVRWRFAEIADRAERDPRFGFCLEAA